jgi:hypothetical protein
MECHVIVTHFIERNKIMCARHLQMIKKKKPVVADKNAFIET